MEITRRGEEAKQTQIWKPCEKSETGEKEEEPQKKNKSKKQKNIYIYKWCSSCEILKLNTETESKEGCEIESNAILKNRA